MIDLNDRTCREVGDLIESYNKFETVTAAAGLLTIASYSANTIRIEVLVHLALARCVGTKRFNRTTLNSALNRILGASMISRMEDPSEDVFSSNVATDNGDVIVFNGIYDSNDYHLQILIDILRSTGLPLELQPVKLSILALLRLSDEIAARSKVRRNEWDKTTPQTTIAIPSSQYLQQYSKRVIFKEHDLDQIGIAKEELKPFILPSEHYSALRNSELGNSRLELAPLVEIDGQLIVTLPGSLGFAIKNYILRECKNHGVLRKFQKILRMYQRHQLTHEVLGAFRGEAEFVGVPLKTPENLPSLTSMVLRTNSNQFIHTILLHEELENTLEVGFNTFSETPVEQQVALQDIVHQVAGYCSNQVDFAGGVTLLTFSGLGKSQSVAFSKWPFQWGFCSLSLNDLVLIATSKKDAIQELLFCMSQKSWVQESGVHIQNINGDMNYFGFWRGNEYLCLPKGIAPSQKSYLALATDFVFAVRKDLRTSADKHTAFNHANELRRLQRLTQTSFYEGLRSFPVYACIDDIENGYLNGAIETTFSNIWFGIKGVSEDLDRGVVYQWWSGFIEILAEILISSGQHIRSNACLNLQIDVDFSDVKAITMERLKSKNDVGEIVCVNGRIITISLQSNYLANFGEIENYGERKLMFAICDAISSVYHSHGIAVGSTLLQAAENFLSNPGVRVIHAFLTFDEFEYLQSTQAVEPVFCDRKRIVFEQLKSSTLLSLFDQTFEGKNDCKKALNSYVEYLWTRIKDSLGKFNKQAIIARLCEQLLAIENDRSQWRRTAKAIEAIYSRHDDVISVAHERESDRSLSSLSIRALIEMALCQSLVREGSVPTVLELEEMISICALLINLASDSDAIHWDLVPAKIRFHANGLHELEFDVMNNVLTPYFRKHFQRQFSSSVDAYDDLYANDPPVKSLVTNENVYEADFLEAFHAEIGASVEETIDVFAGIISILIDDKVLIKVISATDLISCVARNRSLDVTTVEEVISYFSLMGRNSWEDAPAGYVSRDIVPWKYKRRLSCLVKPILKLDENSYFLSFQLLKQGFSYFMDSASRGEFNTEFFSHHLMRSYVGRMVDKRGNEFTHRVFLVFQEAGWRSKKEVLMKTLGAPEELGDIDVIAFKEGELILIECKNLAMAKTVSEIADILNRFKGEAKDELKRHLDRVEWVTENLGSISSKFNLPGEVKKIRGVLLTSTEMPMQYKSDLPAYSSSILSFHGIDSILDQKH